jgi:hypothetical protein
VCPSQHQQPKNGKNAQTNLAYSSALCVRLTASRDLYALVLVEGLCKLSVVALLTLVVNHTNSLHNLQAVAVP